MIDLLDLHQEFYRRNGFILDPLLELLCPVIGEERVNDNKRNAYNADRQGREIEKYLTADSHTFNGEALRYSGNSRSRFWS